METLLEESTAELAALAGDTANGLSSVVILLAGLAAGLLLHEVLYRLLSRLTASRSLFWRSLVTRTRNPVRMALVVAALALAVHLAPLTELATAILRHVLLLGFIAILMRVAQLALHIFTTLHLRRFELSTDDSLLARKHITQARVLRRVANTLILVIGIGAMLTTFDTVRQYGVSLLASAGAAGIVVGLALQPLLKNLFAGIQLAITQPIRIDDVLIVEGEYGNVEEITSTYVVVRTWDRRRLIIPLTYFMERPFENWTRDETALTGVVLLYVDFSVPVPALRKKAEEIVRSAPQWDGEVFSLLVTDLRETVAEIRIIASAADSGAVWDLRCLIREEMITFLAENYPSALPRMRTRMEALFPRTDGELVGSAQQHTDLKGARE